MGDRRTPSGMQPSYSFAGTQASRTSMKSLNAFLCGFSVSVGILLTSILNRATDRVSGTDFELRDDEGRVLARLSKNEGEGVLEFLDTKGDVGASVGLSNEGGVALLRSKQGLISLRALPYPQITLLDNQGIPRLEAGVWDGATELVIKSAGSRRKVILSQSDADGLRITLGGTVDVRGGYGDVNSITQLRVSKEGELFIELESSSAFQSEAGLPDWTMSLENDGTMTTFKSEK